jgi:hypothetical protein
MAVAVDYLAGGLLVAAGVSKLKAPREAALAAAHLFGQPLRRVPYLGVGAGVIEVCLGVGMVVAPEPFAWLSLVFLAALSAAVAVRLRLGARFVCRCFGGTAQISYVTLARALLLSLLLAASLGGEASGVYALARAEMSTATIRGAVLACSLLGVGLLAAAAVRLARDYSAIRTQLRGVASPGGGDA